MSDALFHFGVTLAMAKQQRPWPMLDSAPASVVSMLTMLSPIMWTGNLTL